MLKTLPLRQLLPMIESFKESPLLLLFVVIALGYWVGNISIRGTKLGAAAILFVGLAFGALDAELYVPEVIIFLGLSIFVYTTGLSAGPGFFQTFKNRGAKDFTAVLGLLFFSAACTVGIHYWFGFDKATSTGLLSGTWTNTASLAGLLDLISNTQAPEVRESMQNQTVIGYSISYPVAILGLILSIRLMERWLKIDYRQEESLLQEEFPVSVKILRQTIKITASDVDGFALRSIFQRYHGRIVFGRMERNKEQIIPNMDTIIHQGDQIVLVGNEKILAKAIAELGEKMPWELSHDRSVYDVRRVFVSNPKIVGENIASLNLPARFSMLISRVTRGDNDLIATGDTVLELGDRVLIVCRRDDFSAIAKVFGNSYEGLSKINLFSFGLGMALGLLLGMISFQLPGGITFKLGFAGGPILVALVLGYIRRTGPIVWSLPYSANITLQQIGLILLLAGIGIQSGHTFGQTLISKQGALLLGASTLLIVFTTMVGLFVGHRIFKIPYSLLTGMLASQPAVLDYASDRSNNKLPSIGFALVLPVLLICKIILTQVLFGVL